MKNFNGVFSLLAGLNNTAVSRLKLSWEKVPKKEQAKLKKLMEFIASEGNYSGYRKALQRTKPPLVPYLGIPPPHPSPNLMRFLGLIPYIP